MVHHGEALTRESGDASLAEAVASGRFEELDGQMRALCAYALKLTRTPAELVEADVQALRAAGLDDRAIVDANQVVSYFNYVNRVADGLGVELEPEWPPAVRAGRAYALARAAEAAPVPSQSLPWLSVAQMREVDRLMIEELGISLERMMENAGRSLALLARGHLGGAATRRRLLVLAGPGGNGGGGLVAGRHLVVAGAEVEVRLSEPPERLAPVPREQYAILRRMDVPVAVGGADELGAPELVLDALLGYGQTGDPRGEVARLIERTAGRRVIALDTPSGLELSTGKLRNPHVRAEATLTLALPKEGLRAPGAERAVGELYLADISVPPAVYRRLGLRYESPFGAEEIVRVARTQSDG